MKRSTPRLAFGEPTTGRLKFHPGSNTTVRAGAKWMKHWIKAGEEPFEVVLLGPDGRRIGTGMVEAVEYCQLASVAPLIALCNYAGPMPVDHLMQEVIHQYANAQKDDRRQAVGPTSYVTVVWFSVIPQE